MNEFKLTSEVPREAATAPEGRPLVPRVGEKSQIRALVRTSVGAPKRLKYDYQRHGATCSFALLAIATGSVIGRSYDSDKLSMPRC